MKMYYNSKKVVLIRSNPVNPDPPVEKMAHTLLANGFDVTILGWDRDASYEFKEVIVKYENYHYIKVSFGIRASYGAGFNNLKGLLEFQRSLFAWLIHNRSNYDIIHAYDFDTGLIGLVVSKLLNKSMVYHILDYYIDSHSMPNSGIRQIVKLLENYVISNSAATIICSEKRREQISGSKPRKLYVIHNTPERIIPNSCLNNIELNHHINTISIAYVGILAKSRMILEMLDIVLNNDEYELFIAGFGPLEEQVKELANKTSRIQFFGKVSYDEALAIENSCDIMFAIYDPTKRNNQFAAPNKFYEALMLGKPIIMARNTGFDDVIINKQIGAIVDYSVSGIKDGLEYLNSVKKHWNTVKTTGNALYDSDYSWEIMQKRIVELYSNL